MRSAAGMQRCLRAVAPRRLPTRPVQRGSAVKCTAAAAGPAQFGVFVLSGSPAIAEAVAASGADWMCIDAQHGAVSYDTLSNLLSATSGRGCKRIVRVGGPEDRFGIQQALDLGADGVMVPLINSRAEAEKAVSACLYPPLGLRSVAYPVRAVYSKGVGGPALARYLQDANKEVEVWLQIETQAAFEALDEVLSVPGITSAFLGPADMGFSFGLHITHNYDLAAMLASKELDHVYQEVLEGCKRHGIVPGVLGLGEARAKTLASQGYHYVAYDTDLGALINYVSSTQANLRPSQ